MKRAIEFAKEILRKEDAIRRTESPHLRQQYRRSIDKSKKELVFYCKCKNLDISEVFAVASK